MPSFSKKLNEVQISQVAEFVSESTRSSTMGGSVAAGFKPDDTKIEDCEATDFHCFEQAFANLSYNEGPKTALDHVHQDDRHRTDRARLPPDRPRDRRGGALLLPRQGRPGVRRGPPECTSGYYHGILERAFLGVDAGPAGAAGKFCASAVVRKSEFTAYQCVHGLGHGLMIYTGYDLPLALATCDKLQQGDELDCTGGVFMENFQSSYGIDVAVAERRRPAVPVQRRLREVQALLLRLVTSRILPKVNYNWKKAAAWCRKSEKNWVKVCFQSLGRDASGYTRLDPARILNICRAAGNMARECIYAAAIDMTYTDVSSRRAKTLCHTRAGGDQGLLLDRDRRDPRLAQPRRGEAQGGLRRVHAEQGVPRRVLPRRRTRLALRDAGFERFAQGLAHGLELDAVEHVLEEAAQDQAFRVGLRQAARHRVEELFPVDLADRRAVGAADVVRLDLEAGDRVRVGRRREEEVPVLLVGVRLLGLGLDADHPAPDRGRLVAQRALEREVGRRVRRDVLLERVEVEVLVAVGEVGARDTRGRALPGEVVLDPDLALLRAEAAGDPVELGVAADARAVRREVPCLPGEILERDVLDLRVLADEELDDGVRVAGESGSDEESSSIRLKRLPGSAITSRRQKSAPPSGGFAIRT